jgi:maltose O-acetyltransferase
MSDTRQPTPDTRSMRERMLAGDLYLADDPQIGAQQHAAMLMHRFNTGDPLDAETRRAKWEAAKPITIGNNVWLGGGVIVCPGVTIGDNTVVGAGAVVTKALPANVLAVGNPARIIRELSDGEQGVLRSGARS